MTSIVVAVAALVSSMIGLANGLSTSWLAANLLIYLVAGVWLHCRRTQGGLLSAGALASAALILYGSWATAMAAGQRYITTLVPVPVTRSGLAYTTYAALLVQMALILGSSLKIRSASARTPRSSPDLQKWWRASLRLEGAGLACYVLYKLTSHEALLSFGIFRGSSSSGGVTSAPGLEQFLNSGIDISIGAAILASSLVHVERYRTKVIILLGTNLVLYFTLGFKFRVVELCLGVFGVWASSRPHRSRLPTQLQRYRVVTLAVFVSLASFFTLQVFRSNHDNGQSTHVASFSVQHLESLAVSTIDISTPYAALHDAHLPLLRGRSYTQLPALFVPRVLYHSKPLPAMAQEINEVTTPGVGAAVPLWAEADMNFGLIGLIVFGLLVGMVVAWTDSLDRRDFGLAALASAIAAVLPSVLSRSLMFFALYELAAVALPIWWVCRRFELRTAPSRKTARAQITPPLPVGSG